MSTKQTQLPDWWQREKQRRQTHLLILLVLTIGLIVYFYYISASGKTGIIGVIDFDTSNTIAFVRQESNGQTTLYDIRADGTGLKPLTPSEDHSDKSAPCWNTRGDQFYYASNRDDLKKMQIYIGGAGEPHQLTHGIGRKENPFPTPDGTRVAFITAGAVKTVLPNGEGTTQELPPPHEEGDAGSEGGPQGDVNLNGPYLTAAYSADGSGIAGVKELSSDNKFGDPKKPGSGEARLDGLTGGDQIAEVVPPGETRLVSLDAGNAVSIAWEPNGKSLMVAFAESPKRNPDGGLDLVSGITIYNFANPKQPTAKSVMLNVGRAIMPRNIAWSPNGKQIAFEAWWLKGEKERQLLGLVMMNLPDTPMHFEPADTPRFTPTIAVTPNGQPRLPRWSPDGSRLLFQVTRKDNKNDLWVINADQTNPFNLTKGQGDNTQGAWSPAKAR